MDNKTFERFIDAVGGFNTKCLDIGLEPPKKIRMDYDDRKLKGALSLYRGIAARPTQGAILICGVKIRIEDPYTFYKDQKK